MNTLTQTPQHCTVKAKSIFKSVDAYNSCETLVCYIDKSGKSHTKKDFLTLSGNNESLAKLLFDTVITKSPTDIVQLWKDKDEFPL
jgi:hypothetical protein